MWRSRSFPGFVFLCVNLTLLANERAIQHMQNLGFHIDLLLILAHDKAV